ncbi:MAG: tetratricopeptide repeat protein [Gammaproteobacteria bacterium]|nr:MAG: tetratricopeptide repeat protein [Gammaproteobacteria bacterium]
MNHASAPSTRNPRARWLTALALGAALATLAACTPPEERAANYMKKAEELFAQGDYVKAKLEAANAAQIEPKNARAHYMLAEIAEKQQEFRPMIQQLLMAVDSDPNMVPARVKLGTLYFFGQAYEQAAEQAKAATALAPDDPTVRVLNARLLLQDKKMEEGRKELDAALAKDPDLVDGILLRAAIEAQQGDAAAGLKILDAGIARLAAEAAKPLRQVRIAILAQQNRKDEVEQGIRDLIRDFPKEEELQYQLARFYAGEGRIDDAEKVMRSVIATDPKDVDARLGLAQFLGQMRSPEEAEKALEAFVAEDPDQPELRLALGRLYEATRKPDAALAVYEELAKRDPKSKAGMSARVRVAALKIAKGEIEPGRAQIEAVLADEPDNPEALLIRAGLRVRDKKFDDAIADIRTVLRKEPENTRAMLLLARTHTLMDDKVLAKDAYRRLIAADPLNADGPRELAALEVADKNIDGAEQVLRDHLKKAPGDLDAGSRLVTLLGSQKQWSAAEAEARRMVALPDDKGVGYFQLARVMRSQEKNAEAADAFRKALERNPQWTLALEGLVGTLNAMGRKDEAMKALKDFQAANPQDLSAKFLEGGVRAQAGDKVSAEKIFQEIVTAQPKASMAWAALASLDNDDPAARIEAYKKGLAANPGNAELGMLLGSEYEQQRRWDEAITHYEELLKANPKVEVAANNLAALLLDYRSDAASWSHALELVKPLAETTNPAVLDTIGWAYYRNKDYPKAVQFLERAVAGASNIPMLQYHLGMAYIATNNTAGAKQSLGKAVGDGKAEFPGVVEAKAALAKLGAG